MPVPTDANVSNPTTAELRKLVEEAREQGRQEGKLIERNRVVRIRNDVFAGQKIDTDMLALLSQFDGLLLRGGDN